jgi:hypothetical protein
MRPTTVDPRARGGTAVAVSAPSTSDNGRNKTQDKCACVLFIDLTEVFS